MQPWLAHQSTAMHSHVRPQRGVAQQPKEEQGEAAGRLTLCPVAATLQSGQKKFITFGGWPCCGPKGVTPGCWPSCAPLAGAPAMPSAPAAASSGMPAAAASAASRAGNGTMLGSAPGGAAAARLRGRRCCASSRREGQ